MSGYNNVSVEECSKAFEKMRSGILIRAAFTTPMIGTMPSSIEDIKTYVKHVLKIDPHIDPKNFDAVVDRIKNDEIGERYVASEEGELNISKVYDIKVCRKTEKGPYIASHMVHAMIKVALSRLGIWNKKRGSKGDTVEFGSVFASGKSIKSEQLDEIYIINSQKQLDFMQLQGTVSGPTGDKRSIKYHAEYVPIGSEFEFEFRWYNAKLTTNMIKPLIGAIGVLSLGSGRSIGYGQIKILEASIVE